MHKSLEVILGSFHTQRPKVKDGCLRKAEKGYIFKLAKFKEGLAAVTSNFTGSKYHS